MSDETPIASPRNGPRLLIVEPERAYLGVLARRLGELGYRVATAGGSHQAIAEYYRRPPELILTELKGRQFHCADLVDVVRRDPVHRDLPILVMAARSDASAAAQALRSGADGIVIKPFHFEILGARIERELQRKRALDDLRAANDALDARVIERAIAIGELKARIAEMASERLKLLASATAGR